MRLLFALLLCVGLAAASEGRPTASAYATIAEQLLDDEPNAAHETLTALLAANPGHVDLLALREKMPAVRPVAASVLPPESRPLPDEDQRELESLRLLFSQAKRMRDFMDIQPRLVTLLKRHGDNPELLALRIKVELQLRGEDFALAAATHLKDLGYWDHPIPAVTEALEALERKGVLQPAAIQKAMSDRSRELSPAHLEAAALAANLARAERRRSASDKPKDDTPLLVSDINLMLVYIPGGTLTRSSPGTRAIVGVKLTGGFWLSETEVTQAQWRAVMGSAHRPSNFSDLPDFPLDYVKWDEAMAFCAALTERERKAGRLPSGYSFSLPTEAQWEFGARAGAVLEYPAKIDAKAWHFTNSGRKVHAVATKLPNAWGLYDMQGNLQEWCANTYGSPTGLIDDPPGQTTPSSSGETYTSRGGDISSQPDQCGIIGVRHSGVSTAGFAKDTQGFRIVLNYTPPSK